MKINHTGQELIDLILEFENKLLAEGMDPKGRAFILPTRVMEDLGYTDFGIAGLCSDPLYDRIRNLHEQLYRKRDIASGGSQFGAFMFRGIATTIQLPIIFGTVKIDPYEWNDLTPNQRIWLQTNRLFTNYSG